MAKDGKHVIHAGGIFQTRNLIVKVLRLQLFCRVPLSFSVQPSLHRLLMALKTRFFTLLTTTICAAKRLTMPMRSVTGW